MESTMTLIADHSQKSIQIVLDDPSRWGFQSSSHKLYSRIAAVLSLAEPPKLKRGSLEANWYILEGMRTVIASEMKRRWPEREKQCDSMLMQTIGGLLGRQMSDEELLLSLDPTEYPAFTASWSNNGYSFHKTSEHADVFQMRLPKTIDFTEYGEAKTVSFVRQYPAYKSTISAMRWHLLNKTRFGYIACVGVDDGIWSEPAVTP